MYQTLYKNTCRSYYLFILLGILAGLSPLFAQENPQPALFTYTGKIIDQYGNPVTDVLVTTTDNSYMTVTDENGVFDLESLRGKQIRLDHPGYLNKEITVKSNIEKGKTFIVRISDKYLKDPEEIHVLYGKANRNSYLGSASTVYTDQLTSTMGNTYIQSLQGRISGLYIEQYSGTRTQYSSTNAKADLIGNVPVYNQNYGDNSQYTLASRGWTPEVIVDGVQREFYSIDPDAIESVSLQKDALSSIMLGMRSSAGVLLVTTKEPVKEGFQLSFTGRFGIQSALKTPDPLSAHEYAYLMNEAYMNDGKSPYYTQAQYEAYRDGTNPYLYPNVNWYDEVMKKNAAIQSYNLNASGGNKVAQYFVSMGYMNEEGLFRSAPSGVHNTNLNYERYMITSKVNVNISDDFKIGATLMGRIEDTNEPGAGYGTILNGLMNMPNNAIPVYNPNGSFGGSEAYKTNIMAQSVGSGYATTNARDVLGALKMDYDLNKLLKGLSVSAIGQISSQSRSAVRRTMVSPTYQYNPGNDESEGSYVLYGAPASQGNDYVSVSTLQYMYGQFAVNYKTNIGKHGLGIDLTGDMKSVTNSYDLPSTPANLTARAKYDYDMKYFAEAAIVRSYSNRYRPGTRWGTFYAFGLGWDISRENFLAEADWLEQFKIRGVFGRTGYGINNSDYYSWRHSFSNVFLGGYQMGEGNGVIQHVVENNLPNPNLTWEKAHKLNVGTDIALFGRSLILAADYYNNYMFDVLREREKSVELIGINYSRENIEKRRYQGVDLSLSYQNNIGPFNYFITANWSREKSELVFMDEQYVLADYNRRTGRPVGIRFGLIADGFFTSEEEIANSALPTGVTVQPGDIKYKDLNGDGVINTYDQAVIGNDKPLSFYGLNLGFEYRGFDFSVLLQGVYNRDIYISGDAFRQGFQSYQSGYGQAYSHLMNRWTPETAETATYPRLTLGYNSNNHGPGYAATSFWTESGNYFRLKNLTIGYTLPDGISRNYLGGAKVRVFIGGQNLLTKSGNLLVDPEVTSYSSYPNLRNFHTGLNIKF